MTSINNGMGVNRRTCCGSPNLADIGSIAAFFILCAVSASSYAHASGQVGIDIDSVVVKSKVYDLSVSVAKMDEAAGKGQVSIKVSFGGSPISIPPEILAKEAEIRMNSIHLFTDSNSGELTKPGPAKAGFGISFETTRGAFHIGENGKEFMAYEKVTYEFSPSRFLMCRRAMPIPGRGNRWRLSFAGEDGVYEDGGVVDEP